MVEQAVFKNQAFGGFNKDEVLSYIDNMNARNTEEQEALNSEIASLNAELGTSKLKLEETENALTEKENAFTELMTAYDELREHYMMLSERNGNLQSENEGLNSRAEATEKELEIQKELNRRLSEKIEECERSKDELEEEKKKLVLAANDFGIYARTMVNGAKTSAQSIVSEAENSAEQINGEMENFRAEIAKTRDFMKDSLGVLIQRLEYIEEEAEKAKLSAKPEEKKDGGIQARCEEIYAEIDSKVEALKKRFFQ